MNLPDKDMKALQSRIENTLMRIVSNESSNDSEKKWLIAHSTDGQLKQLIPKITLLGLHVLDTVWRSSEINGVEIARNLGVTKGAISKIIRKLSAFGLISKKRHPDNNKEIYFSISSQGEKLAILHHNMHKELDKKVIEMFKSYDKSSLELIVEFMEKIDKIHSEF